MKKISEDIKIAVSQSTSPWSSFPDDKMLDAFKGLLERWPGCPLCGGKYGFLDYSGPPITLDKDLRIHCLKNRHFHAEVEHKPRKGKDQIYVKKRAMFSLHPKDYNVQWSSNYANKVFVTFPTSKFESKVLKLNFGEIDKWFVPEDQLCESLEKYRVLV